MAYQKQDAFDLTKKHISQDQEVFSISKKLYDEMNKFYQANYIGQQERLDRFVEENIEPLYPSKPVDDLQNLRGSDIITKHFLNDNHHYIRKTSLGQFSEFQLDSNTQTQFSDKSKVIYTNVIRRYKMKQLCFDLGTGNFFCWKTSSPDKVYEDMGLSTCLYLKFVKHLTYVLLMTLPLIIFVLISFYLTAIDNQFVPTTNYQKFLFSFSIGSLSLQQINCQHESIPNDNKFENIQLACPVGTVRVLGPVYTVEPFKNLQNCRKDMDNFLQKQKYFINESNYLASLNCNQQVTRCNYSLNLINRNYDYKKISITFQCVGGYFQIGAITIQRNNLLYIVVVFDLTLTVILCLFLWSQIAAEQKQEKNFKDKQFLLDAFSLQVGPFSKTNFQQQLNQFLHYLEEKNHLPYQISRKKIVQIRLPDDKLFTQHQKKRRESYFRLYQFIGQNFFQNDFNPYFYVNPQDFKNNRFQNAKAYEKYCKRLKKLLLQYVDNQNLSGNNLENLSGNNFEESMHVYITFQKPKYKRVLFQNSNMGNIKVNHKNYQLKEIVPPELLLWHNIGKWKFPRIIVSACITFLTMIGSYVLLAFILSLRQTAKKNFNFEADCPSIYSNNDLANYNQRLKNLDDTGTYVHCYCENNSFITINSQALCRDWSAQYFGYLIIPLFYSVAAVILNIILSFVYKKLSQFEAYHKVTSQLYSYIVKKTLLLVLLLAVVIVILSFEQNQQSDFFYFLYEGTYQDISADWYQQVGVIIIITLTFNMITPLVQVLVYFIKKVVLKFKISAFKKSSNYKKLKKTFVQFYEIDVFPIEERYAQLLAVSAICLTFSCVYPIMILIFVIQLTLFAIIDKIMIIKAYHKPVNFQYKLHKKIVYSFFVILLIRLIVTAVLLTEKYILLAGHSSNSISIVQSTSTRFSSIFRTGYIVPYMTIFVLLLGSLIIISISKLFYITKPTKALKIGKDGIPFEQHKFYNLLNSYQLNRTICLRQKQWHRMKLLEKKYFYRRKQPSQTVEQCQSEPNSASRMIAAQSFCTKPFESSKMLEVSVNQKNDQISGSRHEPSSNQRIKQNEVFNELERRNFMILKKIIKYSLYKLINKKQKHELDRLRVVRLVGITSYEHYADWIFLQDHVKLNYQIQGILYQSRLKMIIV